MRWFDLYVGMPLTLAILGGPPLLAFLLLPDEADPWAHSQKPVHYNHDTRHKEIYVDGALSPPTDWPTGSISGDPTVRSTGTAFAIDRFGAWVTAKHAVEGCRAVVLETAERFLVTAKVVHHRTADLSLIYLGEMTQSVGIPLPDSAFEPAPEGTIAYGFGYGGDNGSRTIESVSRAPIGIVDNDRPDAPRALGQFWSIERLPSLFDRKIGGMSGGPLLSPTGELLGVLVAGDEAERVLITTDPRHLLELYVQDPTDQIETYEPPTVGSSHARSLNTYLEDNELVAEVHCNRKRLL